MGMVANPLGAHQADELSLAKLSSWGRLRLNNEYGALSLLSQPARSTRVLRRQTFYEF
jgi:hypothetical protein